MVLAENVIAMIHMRRIAKWVLALFVSLASASALQQQPCSDPCGVPTPWQDFNGLTVKVVTAGHPGYQQWQGKFDQTADDLQIDVETSQASSIVKGKILMIGGRVMAAQGAIAQPGYEMDALDAAVLSWQLVTKILGRAFPDGPASVKSAQDVDYSDSKVGIKIATQSAGGMIQAPWRVTGKLNRLKTDAVQFDLTLTSPSPGDSNKQNTVTFSGSLFTSPNTKIDDQLSLEGWAVFSVGPQSRKEGNSTILDYGASPEMTSFRTVADVRKKIEADNYAGEPDSSKDFTGFWKENCEDAWGLQIMHYGADGKYSIVFCGPGGCGDPAKEGRQTFITKDSHYQVISETEIREKTADGWETYHRCTKDTHPLLKYKDKK